MLTTKQLKVEITALVIGSLVCLLVFLSFWVGTRQSEVHIMTERAEHLRQANILAIEERNRIHVVERGAEDDAEELGLSQHQEVNYVRCHLRPAGTVTCYVHTPPNDIEVTCRARNGNELLVDGTRCWWTNPETMAHP